MDDQPKPAFTPESWARYMAWANDMKSRVSWVNNPDDTGFFRSFNWATNQRVRALARFERRFGRSALRTIANRVLDRLEAIAIAGTRLDLLAERPRPDYMGPSLISRTIPSVIATERTFLNWGSGNAIFLGLGVAEIAKRLGIHSTEFWVEFVSPALAEVAQSTPESPS